MYDNKAVKILTEAVMDILTPKFDKYIEDRRNDITLQPEIDKIIDEIENYEDLINNILAADVADLSDSMRDNTIALGGYSFDYNKETELFKYLGDIPEIAKCIVCDAHYLNYRWSVTSTMKTRVSAIITTMVETDFDSIVTKIEKDIDFNEFLNL